MKGAMAVAAREIAERKLVAVGALLLGFASFLALRPDRIVLAAGFASAVGAILLAANLGSSVVNSDLAERRMSFYLSRPLSGSAIWAGKAAASMFLIVGASLVMIAPAMLVFRAIWTSTWTAAGYEVVRLLAVPLLIFLLAHVVTTMLRSRSALVLLDLLLVAALFAALLLIAKPLANAFAIELLKDMGVVFVAAFAAVAIAAGAWQLDRGRADIRASHRALSSFLWISLFACTLAAGAFVLWVISATPRDFRWAIANSAARGPWVTVEGRARYRLDYQPAFLVNVRSGAWERLPRFSWLAAPEVIAWPDPAGNRMELMVRRIGGRTIETGIVEWAGQVSTLVTDDAHFVVTAGRGMLTVDDLTAKRNILSAHIPEPQTSRYQFFFDSPSTLRLLQIPQTGDVQKTLRIFEVDIARKSVRQTGAAMIGRDVQLLAGNADGSRLFVRRGPSQSPVVIDGRRGEIVEQLPLAGDTVRAGRILSDGRIAIMTFRHDRWTLHLFAPDGASSTAIDLGEEQEARILDELSGGLLTLAASRRDSTAWTLDVVDLRSARVVRSDQNLTPAFLAWPVRVDDPRRDVAPPDRVFTVVDPHGQLFEWDPRSGARRAVLR